MKKVLVFLAIIMIIIISNKEENIIIPESSIRFRVIANSNTLEDQTTKNKISKNLSSFVSNLTCKFIKLGTTKKQQKY